MTPLPLPLASTAFYALQNTSCSFLQVILEVNLQSSQLFEVQAGRKGLGLLAQYEVGMDAPTPKQSICFVKTQKRRLEMTSLKVQHINKKREFVQDGIVWSLVRRII